MAHFEIHLADVAAGKAFYGALYGWTFDAMPGGEEIDYHLASGEGLGGDLTIGLMKRMNKIPAKGAAIRGGTMTFEVADCDKSYGWALENGGAEALPPMDYPPSAAAPMWKTVKAMWSA